MSHMKFTRIALATSLLSVFALPAIAANDNCGTLIKDVPGTYKLIKRTMPDGTVLQGDKVQGTTIFAKNGYRVTTVAIQKGSNSFSAGVQTEYHFSNKDFSDKLIALALQDGNQPTMMQFNGHAATVPITCKDGKLTIGNPPVDPLSTMTFTKDSMTAVVNKGSAAGATDVWTKVG